MWAGWGSSRGVPGVVWSTENSESYCPQSCCTFVKASGMSRGLTYNPRCPPLPPLLWCLLFTSAVQMLWGVAFDLWYLGLPAATVWPCPEILGYLSPCWRRETRRPLVITSGPGIWRLAFVCFASFSSRKTSGCLKLVVFCLHLF